MNSTPAGLVLGVELGRHSRRREGDIKRSIGKGNYIAPVPNSGPINVASISKTKLAKYRLKVENEPRETSAQAVVRKRGSELSRTTHVSLSAVRSHRLRCRLRPNGARDWLVRRAPLLGKRRAIVTSVSAPRQSISRMM